MRPLPLERCLEASDVDRIAALARHQLCEIDRESEGIVKLERIFASDRAQQRCRALSCLLRCELVKPLHPSVDRIEKPLLLGAGRVDDVLGALTQLGIDVAELVDDYANNFHKRRLSPTQQPGVANAPAQNATKHVPAAFVGGKDSVGEKYRHRPTMISDHAKRRRLSAPRQVLALRDGFAGRVFLRAGAGFPRCLRDLPLLLRDVVADVAVPHGSLDRFDKIDKYIGVETVRLTLHERGDALQPRASVD